MGALPMIPPNKHINDEAAMLSLDEIKEREDALRQELQSYRAARMEASDVRSGFADNRSRAKQEIYNALNTISTEQYSNEKSFYDALNVRRLFEMARI